MDNNLQLNEGLSLVNQLIPLVEEAEKSLGSAKNWSILDLLGGGFIVDLIKHSKLNRASQIMEQVNYMMQRLQQILGSMQIPMDYRVQIGGFATFADFLCDGMFADGYMTYKIVNNLGQVRELKNKLYTLKSTLERL